jgi:hypothetical protein
MTDIVERLRGLRFVHVPVASQLMDEAAAEIERLRNGGVCPHVRGTVTQHCSLNFTLTDDEREAIEWFAELRKPLTRLTQSHNREKYKDTLCGLLERLK